jgi:membrane protease YdiL (CAAX protease family)
MLILCLTIKKQKVMTDLENRSYPNIGQSFGILGIIILASILASTLFFLNKLVDIEALQLIYYLLTFGVSFWIVYSIRKRKTGESTFNFRIENKRIIPFMVVAAIALLFGVISPISELIPMPDFFKNVVLNAAKQSGFFSFLLMAIAAPLFEELIFRGIILDGLLKRYSPVTSILISSIIFGLAHLNPWQFVTAFVIGIFAGWIYYKSRSLILVIIIHAAVNLTGYLMRYFGDFDSASMDKTSIEIYGGVLNYALVIVVSILTIFTCVYYLNKEFKKRENDSIANNCT